MIAIALAGGEERGVAPWPMPRRPAGNDGESDAELGLFVARRRRDWHALVGVSRVGKRWYVLATIGKRSDYRRTLACVG